MRNCAAEVPTLWHLAVLRPRCSSLVQWHSPSAGRLSSMRQQQWQRSSGTVPTLSSRTRQKLHTLSFQLWCLPLPGTSVSLLKSCLQWRCRWCGTKHRNYTPFFLCTHGTCVQNCQSQMQCKASRLYINHPGSIPIFLLSLCSGEEELFVPEVIQENSEWSLVSSLFIFFI